MPQDGSAGQHRERLAPVDGMVMINDTKTSDSGAIGPGISTTNLVSEGGIELLMGWSDVCRRL